VVVLVPGIGLTVSFWNLLRGAYADLDANAGTAAVVRAVGTTLLFVASWVVAVGLAGAGSAVRSALWTAALAPPTDAGGALDSGAPSADGVQPDASSESEVPADASPPESNGGS
jgi:hypothetical protein